MSAPAASGVDKRIDRPTVGVVGGGAWGVALARAARRAGAEVTLFSRRDQKLAPGAPLDPEAARAPATDGAVAAFAPPEHKPAAIRQTDSYADVARARLVVIAAPSSAARTVLRALGDHLDGSHLLVHGIRGLSGDALDTVSEIMRDETPARRLGALGGPVQADELRKGRPSAMVCGSHYPEVIAAVVAAFQHSALRVYGTPDLQGLEWASALVGCLSVGVGFAEQAGAGPGLLAALISRGVDEAARIAAAAGADERTMFGLGGYGDLLASIALEDRPEVVLGKALARGKTLDEAVLEAKLRVEAIPLIPKIARFAKESRVPAVTFDALLGILNGAQPAAMLERLFAG